MKRANRILLTQYDIFHTADLMLENLQDAFIAYAVFDNKQPLNEQIQILNEDCDITSAREVSEDELDDVVEEFIKPLFAEVKTKTEQHGTIASSHPINEGETGQNASLQIQNLNEDCDITSAREVSEDARV